MINADKFEGKVDVDEVLLGKLEEYLLEEDISVVSSAYRLLKMLIGAN